MIPTLTQSLLQFMLWFAIASLFGVISYLLVLKIRMEAAGCGLCAVLFSLVAFFPLIPGAGLEVAKIFLILLACCSPICLLGAFAEGKLFLVDHSFGGRFIGLLCATFSGFLSSACFAFFSSAFDSVEAVGVTGLFVGLLTTPSAIPIFLWLWHSSKTRPDMERHLKKGEDS